MSQRPLVVTAAIVAVVTLLVGTVGAAAEGGTLRVGVHVDEGALTMYSAMRGDPGYPLMMMVYDALLLLDPDLNPQPGLAESYSVSDDGKSVTLSLRKDVTWHDGEPFTADDVVFTYTYIKKYPTSRFTPQVAGVKAIEAADTHRVVITMEHTSAGFVYQPLADVPIIPKHIWQDVTEPSAFVGARIGTGPYKLVDYQPDQYYRFEANKDYYLGSPSVDHIVMPIIKDSTAMFAALMAGEIDAASRALSPELVRDFAQRPQMNIVSGRGMTSVLLVLNNTIEPFDNKDFRRAISLAIDKEDLLETLYLGYALEGSPGWLHPAMPWYLSELDSAPRHDLEEAKRILEELRYRDVSGDGYRQWPDGSPMEFTMYAPSDEMVRVRGAEIIASDYLKKLGLNVKLIVLERSTLFTRHLGWSGTAFSETRDFDLLMWGWAAAVQQWPGSMIRLYHSDIAVGRGNLNVPGYRSTVLDSILEEIDRATALVEIADLAGEAQRIIAADTPVVTLLHPDSIYVYNREVYDGWVLQTGANIVNKLSFLSEEVDIPLPHEPSTPIWAYSLVVLAIAAVVVLLARRRRGQTA